MRSKETKFCTYLKRFWSTFKHSNVIFIDCWLYWAAEIAQKTKFKKCGNNSIETDLVIKCNRWEKRNGAFPFWRSSCLRDTDWPDFALALSLFASATITTAHSTFPFFSKFSLIKLVISPLWMWLYESPVGWIWLTNTEQTVWVFTDFDYILYSPTRSSTSSGNGHFHLKARHHHLWPFPFRLTQAAQQVTGSLSDRYKATIGQSEN